MLCKWTEQFWQIALIDTSGEWAQHLLCFTWCDELVNKQLTSITSLYFAVFTLLHHLTQIFCSALSSLTYFFLCSLLFATEKMQFTDTTSFCFFSFCPDVGSWKRDVFLLYNEGNVLLGADAADAEMAWLSGEIIARVGSRVGSTFWLDSGLEKSGMLLLITCVFCWVFQTDRHFSINSFQGNFLWWSVGSFQSIPCAQIVKEIFFAKLG